MGRISNKPILVVCLNDSLITPVGGVGTKWAAILKALTEYEIYVLSTPHASETLKFNCELVYEGSISNYAPFFNSIADITQELLPRCKVVIVIDFANYEYLGSILKELKIPRILSLELPLNFEKDIALRSIVNSIPSVDDFEAVLTVSNYAAYESLQDFVRDKSKLRLVANGIDPRWAYLQEPLKLPGANEHKLLFIGRVSPEKGVKELLEAEYPENMDLIVIGPYMLPSPYHKMLLTAKKNVYYLGQVPPQNICGYIKSAHAVIMPSITEPFGMVALETLVVGTPLIASYCEGLNTWLTPAAATNCGCTTESIQATLAQYDFNRETHQEQITEGIRLTQSYTISQLVENVKAIIEPYIKQETTWH